MGYSKWNLHVQSTSTRNKHGCDIVFLAIVPNLASTCWNVYIPWTIGHICSLLIEYGCDIGSTCLHVPAGYAGISRWRHNMPAVVCRARFRFVCRAFSPARCHFQHPSMESVAPLRRKLTLVYVKVGRPNALRPWPWYFLLITGYCFTLCKELISPNSYLCIYNKNCR